MMRWLSFEWRTLQTFSVAWTECCWGGELLQSLSVCHEVTVSLRNWDSFIIAISVSINALFVAYNATGTLSVRKVYAATISVSLLMNAAKLI